MIQGKPKKSLGACLLHRKATPNECPPDCWPPNINSLYVSESSSNSCYGCTRPGLAWDGFGFIKPQAKAKAALMAWLQLGLAHAVAYTGMSFILRVPVFRLLRVFRPFRYNHTILMYVYFGLKLWEHFNEDILEQCFYQSDIDHNTLFSPSMTLGFG